MQSSGRTRTPLSPRRWHGFLFGLLGMAGCGQPAEHPPLHADAGPYRVTLEPDPAVLHAGRPAHLTFRVTHAGTGQPVSNLQILHERALHTFIVSRDFSSFAHVHHEDFAPLDADALRDARFTFPYTFPAAGRYLIVNEFTHRDRSWTTHLTLNVDGAPQPSDDAVPESAEVRTDKRFGAYRVALRTSPSPPVAGREVELVCRLSTADGAPVTNLGLYLGSEVHMAVWRLDAAHFGHQHAYTSAMARLMASMRGRAMPADAMAQLMLPLMRGPREQEFFGPEVPLRHVFPAAGAYKVFFEFAPNGEYLVADFLVEVVEPSDAADTVIRSIPSEPLGAG